MRTHVSVKCSRTQSAPRYHVGGQNLGAQCSDCCTFWPDYCENGRSGSSFKRKSADTIDYSGLMRFGFYLPHICANACERILVNSRASLNTRRTFDTSRAHEYLTLFIMLQFNLSRLSGTPSFRDRGRLSLAAPERSQT